MTPFTVPAPPLGRCRHRAPQSAPEKPRVAMVDTLGVDCQQCAVRVSEKQELVGGERALRAEGKRRSGPSKTGQAYSFCLRHSGRRGAGRFESLGAHDDLRDGETGRRSSCRWRSESSRLWSPFWCSTVFLDGLGEKSCARSCPLSPCCHKLRRLHRFAPDCWYFEGKGGYPRTQVETCARIGCCRGRRSFWGHVGVLDNRDWGQRG